eukprot:TRINITY_DN39521_c0_g1_i1.p1 TRINITY_DN39521_c0_g1~~TRINITY_DN39521_c0_g1_i1.p1  ORF type:complete len:103 (+),score=8.84 TRINITY_DN39521_c0_g1_i1:99-407(+)
MQRKGLKISDEDGFVTKDFAEWYDNMRLVLFAVFALATAAEVFYWYRGAPSLPALAVLLIANFWGWLDAVLRQRAWLTRISRCGLRASCRTPEPGACTCEDR